MFQKLEVISLEKMRDGKVKPGYKDIKFQMIFYIYMDGKFTCKARFVEGYHRTDPPQYIRYSSVVSIYSVRVVFMLVLLNDLGIFIVNIGNAYINN